MKRLFASPVLRGVAGILSLLAVALLARPTWREYTLESFAAVGSLAVARSCAVGYRRRLPAARASALRAARMPLPVVHHSVAAVDRAEEVAKAIHGTQTTVTVLTAMRASAVRRLAQSHGVTLNDHERSRQLLGDDLFELLCVPIDETMAERLDLGRDMWVQHLDRLDVL